jgi:predicted membrane-bound spermidine synthase
VDLLGGSPWSFLLLSPGAGFLTGAVFPVASRLAIRSGRSAGRTAGVLDACDHGGALVGAAVTGLVMVPVWGLSATAVLLGVGKAASLLAAARPGARAA